MQTIEDYWCAHLAQMLLNFNFTIGLLLFWYLYHCACVPAAKLKFLRWFNFYSLIWACKINNQHECIKWRNFIISSEIVFKQVTSLIKTFHRASRNWTRDLSQCKTGALTTKQIDQLEWSSNDSIYRSSV